MSFILSSRLADTTTLPARTHKPPLNSQAPVEKKNAIKETQNRRPDPSFSRMLTAVNDAGTVSFTYDNHSRVKTTTDVFNHVIEYGYDANGNRNLLKLDGANYAVYAYDAANRLAAITNSTDSTNIGFGYDIADRLTSRAYPNGVNTTYEYDGMSRLTRLKDVNSTTTIFDRQYSYNAANQISQIVEPARTRTFGYDNVDRLTSATDTLNGNESYSYDAVGNRTASHLSTSCSYQPFNELTSSDTGVYSYNSNGNLERKGPGTSLDRTYSWDYENRMVSTSRSFQTVQYKYDALGRRVSVQLPGSGESEGGLTRFIYDGHDVVMDDDSVSGITKYQNGLGIDNKLSLSSGGVAKYFLADHLGSTNGLTDSGGGLASSANYDSFGNSTNNLTTRYQFTGREFDSTAGLQYSRARWYDSNLGRFMSEDPIGLAGGINEYSYVGNNPLNASDPLGLYETDVHYYLTYFLTKQSGCFNDLQSKAIANGDQLTDEDEHYSPGLGKSFSNRTYHALNDEASPGAGSDYLWWRATLLRNNYLGFGRYLHYLQDTFSHAGYPNSFYGHAFGQHVVDKTATDIEKTVAMAKATYAKINDFSQLNCNCNSQPWSWKMEYQIRRFARVETNYPGAADIDGDTGIPGIGKVNFMSSTDALTTKRIILGVPQR